MLVAGGRTDLMAISREPHPLEMPEVPEELVPWQLTSVMLRLASALEVLMGADWESLTAKDSDCEIAFKQTIKAFAEMADKVELDPPATREAYEAVHETYLGTYATYARLHQLYRKSVGS